MTYTLTADESKVAQCGSVDYSLFTDPAKGWENIDLFKYFASGDYPKMPCNEEGISFIVQDVLDLGYTKAQAKTIIDSLIAKGVLVSDDFHPWTLADMQSYDPSELNPFQQTLKDKTETIDGNWLYVLTQEYINYIAAQ
jgi:hypothetical protein|tara:strand:+ start:80 stop:496 length:417 start_codon:yes stop_codon:yes gene_type:complete